MSVGDKSLAGSLEESQPAGQMATAEHGTQLIKQKTNVQ